MWRFGKVGAAAQRGTFWGYGQPGRSLECRLRLRVSRRRFEELAAAWWSFLRMVFPAKQRIPIVYYVWRGKIKP
jgi:hypothetical protein